MPWFTPPPGPEPTWAKQLGSGVTSMAGSMGETLKALIGTLEKLNFQPPPPEHPAADASPERRRLFEEPPLIDDANLRPLDADLQQLFTRYEVEEQVQKIIRAKKVTSSRLFYSVGHDSTNSRLTFHVTQKVLGI